MDSVEVDTELLMKCPFRAADVQELKNEVIVKVASTDMDLTRCSGDRNDVPIDIRFLDLLLRAAGDTEVGLGRFAKGVRVGPGARMPRLSALYKQKRKWRPASQADPQNYLEAEAGRMELTWRRNYAPLAKLRQGSGCLGGPDAKPTERTNFQEKREHASFLMVPTDSQ